MSQQYPTSEDKKIQLLSEILTSYLYQEEVSFCIEEQELYAPEVAGHFGCLTLLLIPAKENFEKAYNQNFSISDLAQTFLSTDKEASNLEENKKLPKDILLKTFPIEFIDNEEAYFNVEPMIDSNQSMPFAVLAHFVHHAVEEYILAYKNKPEMLVNGAIPLDPLYEKWKEYVLKEKVIIRPRRTSGSTLENIGAR